MTRDEIIAHLDTEINLLLRARDILTTPLAAFMKASPRKPKGKSVEAGVAGELESAQVEVPVEASPAEAPATAAPLAVPESSLVRKVPARRRMERRQSPDKQAKSSAALSGHVPAGPVAVSAVEARKVQDRPVAVPAPATAVELRPEAANERSLGSLIQAFERRSGLSGLEIP